jgi:hypothetical protein
LVGISIDKDGVGDAARIADSLIVVGVLGNLFFGHPKLLIGICVDMNQQRPQ